MNRPLYDLSNCIVFCVKRNESDYNVGLLSAKGEFLASTHLDDSGGNVFVPDGIVARRGFGRSFHRLLVDIATDLGGALAIVRDGDARGGALTVWESLYLDDSLERINISEQDNDLDWADSDEYPELFHAYRTDKVRYLESNKIQYAQRPNAVVRRYIKQGAAIFHRSYEEESNQWIDEKYPLSAPVRILESTKT